MEKLVNPQKTIEIIQKMSSHFRSVSARTSCGCRVLDKIIQSAGVTKEDCVLEVGPGIGTMTQALSEAARQVVAVEIDDHLIPILQETLKECPNVKVIHGDILKTDVKAIAGRVQRRPPAACGGEPALLHHHADHHGTL